jgi:predicted permease
VLEGVNAVAASQFVALVIALVACVFLWRLILRLLERYDKQWELIGTLAAGLKDNNAITERALDAVERSAGTRA